MARGCQKAVSGQLDRDCGIWREIVGVKKKRGRRNVENCGEMWTNVGKRGIGGYAGAKRVVLRRWQHKH
jgi:hypothetical protein